MLFPPVCHEVQTWLRFSFRRTRERQDVGLLIPLLIEKGLLSKACAAWLALRSRRFERKTVSLHPWQWRGDPLEDTARALLNTESATFIPVGTAVLLLPNSLALLLSLLLSLSLSLIFLLLFSFYSLLTLKLSTLCFPHSTLTKPFSSKFFLFARVGFSHVLWLRD